MARIEDLPGEVRTFVEMYAWHRIDPVPWAKVSRPLSSSRVGLVVAACMTMPDQPPFHAEEPDNDPSIRVVPSDMDPMALVNTFPGQAFDHSGLEADANLLVPLDRLREMTASGTIGGLTARTASLCGHIVHPKRLMAETAPAIARMFVEDGADVAMLVPA
jgi:D-proline reductase (dithiol) PrdB